jgi:hypothetical protein
MPDVVKTEEVKPKYLSIPSHLKTSTDENGNVLIEGSIFANPHVVGALVGTKSVTCETKAVGEELQFVIKLGVTKSIHDVKPVTPAPNTVTVPPTPKEKDIVHPAPVVAPSKPVVAPSKPGTQAPIPATPEKGK